MFTKIETAAIACHAAYGIRSSPAPETGTDAAGPSSQITDLLRNALEFALYDLYLKTTLQILRLVRSHYEYAILWLSGSSWSQ